MGKSTDIFLSDAIVRLSNAGFRPDLTTDAVGRQWLRYTGRELEGSIRVNKISTRNGIRKTVCERKLPC